MKKMYFKYGIFHSIWLFAFLKKNIELRDSQKIELNKKVIYWVLLLV